jgi:flavodoxin
MCDGHQSNELSMNPWARFRPDCLCPKINCPRHGYCDDCEAYHFAKDKLPYCMRTKAVLDTLKRLFKENRMDTLVVYDSTFGNTYKIAQAIAKVMEWKGSARLTRVDQLNDADLEGINLMIVGFPTHRHGMPETARTMLESLPSGALRGVGIAAFDTRYQKPRWLSGSAAGKLSSKLRKLGGRRVVAPESFFVDGREGPLAEGELERARLWAESLLGV